MIHPRACALDRYPLEPPTRNLPKFHRQEVAESEFKSSKVHQFPKNMFLTDKKMSFSFLSLPISGSDTNTLVTWVTALNLSFHG